MVASSVGSVGTRPAGAAETVDLIWFFGVADVLLAIYGTLDTPIWRRLAVVLVGATLVGILIAPALAR